MKYSSELLLLLDAPVSVSSLDDVDGARGRGVVVRGGYVNRGASITSSGDEKGGSRFGGSTSSSVGSRSRIGSSQSVRSEAEKKKAAAPVAAANANTLDAKAKRKATR